MSRLIDADALMKDIKGRKTRSYPKGELEWTIEQQPTIEAVPVVHGFNDNRNFNEVDEFCCSVCGLHLEDWSRRVYDEENDDEFWVEYAFKYCPECGAKMKGGA